MLFRCTQKALKEFGLPLKETYPVNTDQRALDTWYVNLFRYARRKCLIFTNEQTLYTVIVVGVTKRDVGRLRELFRSNLQRQLAVDGISAEAIENCLANLGQLTYAKTESRRVLGSMNDQVRVFTSHCDYRGGYGVCDFEMENRLVNDMPMRQGKAYIWPTKEMMGVLGDT